MELIALLLFIPTCFALNMAPGPNNLLAMHNGQRYGLRYALGAGLGRLLAFTMMIFLAATGLAAVLFASEALFFAIKILGALYLFWIAVQLWRADPKEVGSEELKEKSFRQLLTQEFLLAAGNPKAILIFTAFLPQFVDTSRDANTQFLVLGGAFLCLEFLAIGIYAAFGVYLKHWFSRPEMRQRFNRICGSCLAFMGVGLLVDQKA